MAINNSYTATFKPKFLSDGSIVYDLTIKGNRDQGDLFIPLTGQNYSEAFSQCYNILTSIEDATNTRIKIVD